MGLNAVVTFSIIGFQQANVPWQVGMSVIFVEGLIIFALVLSGAREAIMNAIPLDLKRAIGVGIGLFITVLGLIEGGIIVPNAATVVSLGDFTQALRLGHPDRPVLDTRLHGTRASRATSSGASSSPPLRP